MKDEFYKVSVITGKEYNVFATVKILNMQQAMAYWDNGVLPVDIRIGRNVDDKRCLVFYFNKDETKEVYDKWCKYELK